MVLVQVIKFWSLLEFPIFPFPNCSINHGVSNALFSLVGGLCVMTWCSHHYIFIPSHTIKVSANWCGRTLHWTRYTHHYHWWLGEQYTYIGALLVTGRAIYIYIGAVTSISIVFIFHLMIPQNWVLVDKLVYLLIKKFVWILHIQLFVWRKLFI